MAKSAPELPFYMKGNFAPVEQEVTAFDLPVQGAIPPELRGLYLRNGPNPRRGDPGHWFFGDGMIHGVRLEDGQPRWYRNRWVRSKCLANPEVQAIGMDGQVDRTVAVANTNVIGHANRIFALVEIAFPTELTRELDTIGVCDFEGRLTTAMTAHPKHCPRTGELHFFGYGFLPPFLTYHRLDAAGKLMQSEVIEVPGPTMMHDFAITDGHVIFMDLPIVFSVENAMKGTMPYVWSDDYGARLGVMPRGGSNADVRWLEIEPCYVFHPFNAFERDGKIVLDVARYPELWRGTSSHFDPAHAHRFTLDLEAEKVHEQRLDDRSVEFPRVDDRLGGQPHRYGYAVVNAEGVDDIRITGLVKYDLDTGKSETHDFGPGRLPGEGVFVPASDKSGEDEGYVMAYVYDEARNGSDFVILDATRFSGPPVATVPLPQRVPFGFHGNWVADPA